jgi:protocatechuate 3,4-dioxygenase beta subunit
MIRSFVLCALLVNLISCASSQEQQPPAPRLVGDASCEGCDGIFEYGAKTLRPVDTLPSFPDGGTRIRISGTVYQPDGKTPAPGVILYVYHTNREGIYPRRGGETGWGLRHGYIRGWVKTGRDGRYTFYTTMPGSYPGRTDPAHIHATVLEPDGKYYWIVDYLFEGDPKLTDAERSRPSPRGGSGIIALKQEGGLMVAQRDIILGKNVPSYR